MDIKTFLPDFSAVAKSNWSKPSFNTSTPVNIAMLVGAALMLVFVFTPWTTFEYSSWGWKFEGSTFGFTTWYGFLGFLCAVAAVVGVLYGHTELTFCAAVLGLLFGLLGVIMVADVSEGLIEYTSKEIKALVKDPYTSASVGHWGAYIYLVATVVTGAASYLWISKK